MTIGLVRSMGRGQYDLDGLKEECFMMCSATGICGCDNARHGSGDAGALL